MGKFSMMHLNYPWSLMRKILFYDTKSPYKLTKNQQITRLYRSYLRIISEEYVFNFHNNFDLFNRKQYEARCDFQKLFEIERDTSEFVNTIKKYEDFIEDNYDPIFLVHDSLPHSPAAGRYTSYTDEQLTYDPFGYYKQRTYLGDLPDSDLIYYVDFPMNDTAWEYDSMTFKEFENNKELKVK